MQRAGRKRRSASRPLSGNSWMGTLKATKTGDSARLSCFLLSSVYLLPSLRRISGSKGSSALLPRILR